MTPVSQKNHPFCVACVSGKGGVGKTMISANLAWANSQTKQTLLIDMDFQNQGSSGLFAPHYDLSNENAFEAITTGHVIELKELTKVSEKLYFLPAVSWSRHPPTDDLLSEIHNRSFQTALQNFLFVTCTRLGFEIIVLDCHGGIDLVSFSAFRLSDVTLVITEADSVTFGGTLELLDFYKEQLANPEEIPTLVAKSKKPNQNSQGYLKENENRNVKFIVNRLPSKYKFAHLEKIYKPYLSGRLGELSTEQSVFCYIPAEELLADSFGEYPFHLPLAPNSIFSKKIKFITYNLITQSGKFDERGSTPVDMYKKFATEKVKRQVISNEQKNVFAVMNFFAWSCIVLLFYIIFGSLILSGIDTEVLKQIVAGILENEIYQVAFFSGVLVSLSPVIWYFLKAMIGIMLYFRNKHLYQKNLFKVLKKPLAGWRALTLLRSFVFRWATTVGVWFFVLFFVGMFVGVVQSIFELLFYGLYF